MPARATLGHLAMLMAIVAPVAATRGENTSAGQARKFGDLLWAWGTVRTDSEQKDIADLGPATFVESSAAQKAKLLGVPNVIMAGSGMPRDDTMALRETKRVSGAAHVVWEIATDDGEHKPPFRYDKTAQRIKLVAEKYRQVNGILLDDMTSLSMKAGFRAEHIRVLREQLPARVKVWGVVYTMNLGQTAVDPVIEALDVINLWVWHAKDIAQMEENVGKIERKFPKKPIVLGLYLYDYGGGRRMPPELMRQQCELALKLAHQRRVAGVVFLTINNDPEIVRWTIDWIKSVANQEIGKPVESKPAQAK